MKLRRILSLKRFVNRRKNSNCARFSTSSIAATGLVLQCTYGAATADFDRSVESYVNSFDRVRTRQTCDVVYFYVLLHQYSRNRTLELNTIKKKDCSDETTAKKI